MFFAAMADIRLARSLVAWRADHARFFVSRISIKRKRLARTAKACILGGVPALLAGCSMAFPISPLMSPGSNEDATGALPKSSLAGLLGAEDWRRAKAALSTALDPQGNGSLAGRLG
jgi:hypothetical protein